MAVDVPQQGVQVTPQTVPDAVRMAIGLTLIGFGLALLLMGIIILSFPIIGGNSAPALQYGPVLAMAGVGVIWDRQSPVIKAL